jgi:peptidoglycan/LPS O-acetylase OafA/YrhL
LRAFAVIVVIFDHLFHWPNGGFIGVDVFFVISGFLITGHLLREYAKTGHISFFSFYKKRTKRILPAASLVLVTTLVAAYILFNQARFKETLWDAVWGLFFGANWRFAAIGTDYFQADGPVSPLQHYWSLAVEEQFYFVWPWLLLLTFYVFLRGKRSSSDTHMYAVAGAAIGVVSVASLAWGVFETATNPGLAYFSTFSRGWELGMGAGLACATPLLAKIRSGFRPVLAWMGLAGMVASLFVIDESMAFPAPAALLPVLSAGLVIAAGTGTDDHRSMFVLTNRVSRYVGDISYSLYLWHFPAIIFGSALTTSTGPGYYVGVLAATAFASISAYNLWEDPVRSSGWLEGRRRSSRKPTIVSARFKYTALSSLAILTAVTVVLTLTPRTAPIAAYAPTAKPTAGALANTGGSAQVLGPAVSAIQRDLTKALQATEWPQLSPMLDDAIGGPQARAELEGCGKPNGFSAEACTFGNAAGSRTAVILGNSVAMTMAGPLIDALGGWRVIVHGAFGCPFSAAVIPNPDAAIAAACPGMNADGIKIVQDLKPDVVFVVDSYEPHKAEGAETALTPTDWEASVETAIKRMGTAPKRVVFLTPPPSDKDIARCYRKLSTPSDCVTQVQSTWTETFAAESDMAPKVRGTVVNTKNLFCVEDACPAFAGSTPTKSDRNHITVEYGRKIAPGLRELLAGAKVV